MPRRASLLAAAAAVLWAGPALALQPLQEFVAGARKQNPDELASRANVEAQRAQADLSRAFYLPGFSLRGAYSRNQYELTSGGPGGTTIVIQPENALDAQFLLTVPLVDLAAWRQAAAARTGADAAARSLEATDLIVEAQAVQDYYQLVANLALQAASKQALDVSREGLRLAEARFKAGASAALDVDRARADVEQQTQQVASAELQVALAARALESVSGVAPDLSSSVALEDDLHREGELASFEGDISRLPSVAAATLATRAADEQAQAQRLTLVPALTGTILEAGSNASGFSGHDWQYKATLALTWSIDFTTPANIRLGDALLAAARASELRVRLAARDAIHRQWSIVVSDIDRSRSARVGQAAAEHAAQLAHDRYQAGTTTQLELLQAQRDAFAAQVNRIQADADLANARLQLRLAAGQSYLK